MAIMHTDSARKGEARKVILTAAGTAMLVLAALSVATNPGPAAADIELPPRKPTAQVDADMDSMAAQLGLVEPAGFTPDFVEPDAVALLTFGTQKTVPVPAPKPAAKPTTQPTAGPVVENNTPASGPTLATRDAALYQRIFTAQQQGDFRAADRDIAQLADRGLMGHVLFQRYMHHDYRSSFDELRDWMAAYADHPGADRIHRLAGMRRPAGDNRNVKAPVSATGMGAGTLHLAGNGEQYTPPQRRSATQRAEIKRLTDAINADIRQGSPTRALRRINNDAAARLMDDVEYDRLRARIANGYVLMGKPEDAYKLALASWERSGEAAPMAGWAGGLAAWIAGDYTQAAKFFESTAQSPYVNTWLKAGAAYWTARAHMRNGNRRQVNHWLNEAAQHPRTFYGMIAVRALGRRFDFDWSAPDFNKAQQQKLAAIPAAARAMALVRAGQNHLAEAELLRLNAGGDEALQEALLAYAHRYNLPGLALRLANHMTRPDGGLYDAALYPVLPWEPQSGFTVDRALIHAIIRQESRFNINAESHRGATGLMQVMPATAGYMDRDRNFNTNRDRADLRNPRLNLELGQRYVEYLLAQGGVGNDLLSMAIAYNAGPGNLRKWKREIPHAHDDPLLFIELIPMAETRTYVERVLANYWIYALRMNQPLPSLDSVAEGKWANYVPLDNTTQKTATRLSATLPNPFRLASRD